MDPCSLIGCQVGRYRVTERISEDGEVAVYGLLHLHLRSPHVLRLWSGSQRSLARMRRDARVQAHLRHRSLVPVSDVIEVRGRLGVVRERIVGPTLDAWVQQRPVCHALAREVVLELAYGLRYAHSRGLVHRDLGPHNVRMQRIVEGWLPRITDFGRVKVHADPQDTEVDWQDRWMGTVGFVAPEQLARPAEVDARADLFSLGCLLYLLLYRRPPFAGTLTERLAATLTGRALWMPGPPPDLIALGRAMLTVDPEDRPPSADAVIATLEAKTAA